MQATNVTALTEPYPPYAAIGIRQGDDYRQLSTSLLQIENEFYGTIRPKRRINSGERPLHALNDRGVEYVEVRCMDLNPFSPIGIDSETACFLDVFLLHCLLTESPDDSTEESLANARNQHSVAERGRDPGGGGPAVARAGSGPADVALARSLPPGPADARSNPGIRGRP